MPIFQDSENKPKAVPAGDYVLCVLEQENGLSKKGDPQYKLKLKVEGKGVHCSDFLTDSEAARYRIDTFVKSCGVVIEKGKGYSLSSDEAQEQKWAWVRTKGLRGWATLRVNDKGYNEVAVWITNKEKLPKRVIEEADVPDGDEIPF